MLHNTYQTAHYAWLCIAERKGSGEKKEGKKSGIECLHLISVTGHLFVVFKEISDQ